MEFGYHERQLVILGSVCLTALGVDRWVSKSSRKEGPAEVPGIQTAGASTIAESLTRKYLLVYGLVMGADWLQGPYVYSLYREQYGFSDRIVAILFVLGFLAAGVGAPLVGVWADQYGRRRLCLTFCITYTSACIAISMPSLPILLFGRIFGGVSTSILFSSFESWLISAASSSGLTSTQLSNIMGRATLLNGLVATGAGMISNHLVSRTRTFVSPFVASGVLLMLAWVLIRGTWGENYGARGGSGGTSQVTKDVFQIKRLAQAWSIVQKDPVLLVLGLAQTCFEGSMYLFVFLWVPALQESSKLPATDTLPLGLIFSSFMISMMLGSLVYTAIISYHSHFHINEVQSSPSSSSPSSDSESSSPTRVQPLKSQTPSESPLSIHAKLLSLLCAFSAFALASSVTSKDSHHRFWSFCLFEACVGMYYPVQGMLRGTLIGNEHRATLSSLFRIPLNIFVVVSLLTGASEASSRAAVLSGCAIVLSISAILTGAVIVRRAAERAGGHGEGQPLRTDFDT